MSYLSISSVCTHHQIDKIAALGAEIWIDHYSPIIGLDQVNYMLDKFQSSNAIQSQIKEGYQYFSLNVLGNLIGYLSIQNRAQHLFISKMYIHKKYRNNGYFNDALEFIKDIAIESKQNKIQLTVNKYNTVSIAVYEKKGFQIKESAVFDIGNGFVMDDYIMELDNL